MILSPPIFYLKYLEFFFEGGGGVSFKMINENIKSFGTGANQLLINDTSVSNWKFYNLPAAAAINLADHF